MYQAQFESTGNQPLDAQKRLQELEASVASNFSGGIGILNRHWSYFRQRPPEDQTTYLFGLACISTLSAFAAYKTATYLKVSPTQAKGFGLVGAGTGVSISTKHYIDQTEQEPDYQSIQQELTIEALQEKIDQIYDQDPILKEFCCPINLTIMRDPVILPYNPTTLADWKTRQQEPCSPYVCDRSAIQEIQKDDSGLITHPETRHQFAMDEIVDDHVTAIKIYKRIRHLINNDLRLTPENHSEERKFIKEKYLEEVHKILDERYKKISDQVCGFLTSQELTIIQEQIRQRFNEIGLLRANPWASEEVPLQTQAHPQPTYSKEVKRVFDQTLKTIKLVSEIPLLAETQ